MQDEEAAVVERPRIPIHFLLAILSAWVSLILIGVGAGSSGDRLVGSSMGAAAWFLISPFVAAASASALARQQRFVLATTALLCAVVNAVPWIAFVARGA